jgi:hypothetical protein
MLLSKNTMHIIMPGQENSFDSNIHLPACFIIGDLVVENGLYSKEFFNLFNESRAEEREQLENGDILFTLIHNEDGTEQGMHLNERLGSIMLSEPKLIKVPEDSLWVTIGSKYIDGVFYP